MTHCFSDSAGPLASQAIPQRGTRGQPGENSTAPQDFSPGRSCSRTWASQRAFCPTLASIYCCPAGWAELDEETLRQQEASHTNLGENGSCLTVDHPVQVSILQLAPLSPKKNPIYKEQELGFGMRTLTPNPDKKDGRSCPCLCHLLFVTVAGLGVNVCITLPPRPRASSSIHCAHGGSEAQGPTPGHAEPESCILHINIITRPWRVLSPCPPAHHKGFFSGRRWPINGQ